MTKSIRCSYSVDGKGPALALVHGVGARGQMWERVVEIMKPHFTCITYDLRGHGNSPKLEGPITLDDLVADLEALREDVGIERLSVFGHSLGGMVAPAYARAFPGRTSSVGLLSTAAFRTQDDSARVRGIAANIRAQGVEKLVDGFVSRWFTEAFLRNHPEIVEARKKQVLATDPAVFADVFRLYAETEMAPWLHEVNAPALVLTGEHDVNCSPRLNEQMAAALPNAKLVVLDNLKHGLVVEAPERIARAMQSFLVSL
jgi:pimeloyl-ACP methyl ester carboxylesterase